LLAHLFICCQAHETCMKPSRERMGITLFIP
jgi:hypothetical protein